jgi:hypothetical protein
MCLVIRRRYTPCARSDLDAAKPWTGAPAQSRSRCVTSAEKVRQTAGADNAGVVLTRITLRRCRVTNRYTAPRTTPVYQCDEYRLNPRNGAMRQDGWIWVQRESLIQVNVLHLNIWPPRAILARIDLMRGTIMARKVVIRPD